MNKKTKIAVSILLLLLVPGCMAMGKALVIGVQAIHTIGHLFGDDEHKEDIDEKQQTDENID